MERITGVDELLDGALDDPATLAGNLRDLRRTNRWLGGVALSEGAIEALAAHRTELTVLDVGAGGADIPLALIARASARGRSLQVVALDSRAEVLAAAAHANPAVRTTRGLTLQVGDGRSIPYPDRSFDIVHASLVLHHLSEADARAFIAEMGRVARLGIIVNDLSRSRLAWVGAWVIAHTLTRNRFTRHDAPLSVRRAYLPAEAWKLMLGAGLVPVQTRYAPFRHRYAIAATRAGTPDDIGAGGLP